ncbi:LytR C-terminal domain-containing protein [Propionibacteriaceae bacterium G1746]|uniref:LytR C-terminal domain-containing protein n=1 Tax=Aestuariimicrobium sp. G57 TaxID=3418485 RepID=UPI003C296C24
MAEGSQQLEWKRVARALATPVTLLVLLAILYFGARWGYRNLTAAVPPAPVASCTPQSVGSVLPSSRVTVNIYNGSTTQGLAANVSRTMKARGFIVEIVDNTEEKVEGTVVVGVSKDDPAVKLVAAQLVGATIKEDGVTDGVIDIMVGSKFAGYTKTPSPWQIEVKDNPCLLPPSETPTPSARTTPGATPS